MRSRAGQIQVRSETWYGGPLEIPGRRAVVGQLSIACFQACARASCCEFRWLIADSYDVRPCFHVVLRATNVTTCACSSTFEQVQQSAHTALESFGAGRATGQWRGKPRRKEGEEGVRLGTWAKEEFISSACERSVTSSHVGDNGGQID